MFENIVKFKKWLKSVCKYDVSEVYLQGCLEELQEQYGNTAIPEYELSRFETKSGNPEIYKYMVIIRSNDDFSLEIKYIL